jgi:putative flippase GtrA
MRFYRALARQRLLDSHFSEMQNVALGQVAVPFALKCCSQSRQFCWIDSRIGRCLLRQTLQQHPMANDAAERRYMPSRTLLLEMVRFGIMGATSAGVYLALLIPITHLLRTRLWLAATIAYVLSMAINYVLQRNYTFKSERPHQEAVTRFVVVQSIGLALNAGVLEYAATYAHWPLWMAQGAAVSCVAVWSYGAQKVWVFVGERHNDAADALNTTSKHLSPARLRDLGPCDGSQTEPT